MRLKVEALYPSHEVEEFTEHFWGLIQFWRRTEADRLGRPVPGEAPAGTEGERDGERDGADAAAP